MKSKFWSQFAFCIDPQKLIFNYITWLCGESPFLFEPESEPQLCIQSKSDSREPRIFSATIISMMLATDIIAEARKLFWRPRVPRSFSSSFLISVCVQNRRIVFSSRNFVEKFRLLCQVEMRVNLKLVTVTEPSIFSSTSWGKLKFFKIVLFLLQSPSSGSYLRGDGKVFSNKKILLGKLSSSIFISHESQFAR